MDEELLKQVESQLKKARENNTLESVEHSGDLELIADEHLPVKRTQFDLFDTSEIVRPEINLARHASQIFVSPYSARVMDVRKYEWVYNDTDGEQYKAGLTIHPLKGCKTPTTTTFAVLNGLIQIWEQMGKPVDGKITFSARQLAHLCNWKWAGKVGKKISEHLDILSGTEISWLWAFQNKKQGSKEEIVHKMNILFGQTTYYRERDQVRKKDRFSAVHKVQFNSIIIENMVGGLTLPIHNKALLSIKSTTAQVVYSKLNIILKKQRRTERTARNLLFDDLELTGERLQQKKHRKVLLNKIVKAIDGKPVAYGVLHAYMKDTADGKDVKLVAEVTHKAIKSRKPPTLANPKEMAEMIADDLISGIKQLNGGRPFPFNEQICTALVKWYSKGLLFEVLSETRADYRDNIETTPIRIYLSRLHVRVHQLDMKWFSDTCPGETCQYQGSHPLFKS